MGNTSFILVRDTQRDALTGPATQFAELTGAYWLEPIYARLANEWSRQGRTVPGAQSGRLRLLTENAGQAAPAEHAEPAETARPADAPESEPAPRPVPRALTLGPAPLAGVTVLPGRAARTGRADEANGGPGAGQAGLPGPQDQADGPA